MDDVRGYITNLALDEGFTAVGFSRSEYLEKAEEYIQDWLIRGKHGKMSYLDRYLDLRTDPSLLNPGTRTVISMIYNYNQDNPTRDKGLKISTYALGRDYHKVIRKKLKNIARQILENVAPDANIRYFTDSGPVLEKEWARRAGLGWVGKNTLLIHPKRGSYFFLAEILIDIDIPVEDNAAIRDHCGTCTRCIDACPTDAISPDGYKLDASRCISYLTIELKDEELPDEFKGRMEDWVFGCDICQQVCPWNKFSSPTQEADFTPVPGIGDIAAEDWQNMTQEQFERIFLQSPIKRTGLDGMKRNVEFVKKEE